MKKAIKREIEVAFSKHSQAIWIRVLKWIAIVVLIYFYWEEPYFWYSLIVVFVLSISLHLFIRYKTKGWTRSYGAWKHESEREGKK